MQGAPTGHQYVHMKISIPKTTTPRQKELLQEYEKLENEKDPNVYFLLYLFIFLPLLSLSSLLKQLLICITRNHFGQELLTDGEIISAKRNKFLSTNEKQKESISIFTQLIIPGD